MRPLLWESVSLVIPAYNEAPRLEETLLRLTAPGSPIAFSEIIVVDDGSRDGTAAVVHRFSRTVPGVRLIHQPVNRGKGAAVKRGMLAAASPFVCFCDADLPVTVDTLIQLVELLQQHDVVIASRGPGAHGRRMAARTLMSWAFRSGIQRIFSLPYADTQCGVKGFRHDAAQAIFSRAHVAGFAFDVEVLLLAQLLGYRIGELPVEVSNAGLSTVRIIAHSLQALRDVWRIRRNLRRGAYLSPVPSEAAPVIVSSSVE